MFNFRKNIVYRYYILVVFGFTLFALVIIGNAAFIMFKERDEWNKIKERNIKYNVPIEPHRGKILNDKGEFVLIVEPALEEEKDIDIKGELVQLMESGMSKSEAVKTLSKRLGIPKNDVYAVAVTL